MIGSDLTTSLAARAIGTMEPDEPTMQLSSLTVFLVLGTLILLAPVYLFVMYSMSTMYPILAIVENPSPPAYDAVVDEENDATPAPPPGGDSENAAGVQVSTPNTKPVTSSIRRTFRLLYASSGLRGNCRGLYLFVVYFIVVFAAREVLRGIFIINFIRPLASLLVMLALAPLHAGWVHAIISKGAAPLLFWRNLPPYRKTMEATCIPIFLFWAGSLAVEFIPGLLRNALKVKVWDPSQPAVVPDATPSMVWKLLLVTFVQILLPVVFLTIPTVLLVRAQASLLAPDANTIVPFDRSFDGKVEPAVVGGRGYVTMRDAFRTFSGASWARLLILYAKVNAVAIVLDAVVIGLVVTEVILTSKKEGSVN